MSQNITKIAMGDALDVIESAMLAQWSDDNTTGERFFTTPILLGPPGCAKTEGLKDVARRVAERLGKSLLINTTVLVDREVPDIRGMPLPVRGEDGAWERLVYTRSAILPSPAEEAEFDVVLQFVDEVTSAGPDHQKSVASLFNDYEIGTVQCDPRKYFVVGAGNGTEHRAGATRLLSHVINRCCVFHVEPDIRRFLQWASQASSGMPPVGAAFVEQFPTDFANASVPSDANTPFPTLRSITHGVRALLVAFGRSSEGASSVGDLRALNRALDSHNAAKAQAVLAGHVGAGTAMEFLKYARVAHKLTSKMAIVKDPLEAPVPSRADMSALYAQALYCAYWTDSAKVAEAMLKYIDRFPIDLIMPTIDRMDKALMSSSEKRSIFTVKGFSDLTKKHPGLVAATFS